MCIPVEWNVAGCNLLVCCMDFFHCTLHPFVWFSVGFSLVCFSLNYIIFIVQNRGPVCHTCELWIISASVNQSIDFICLTSASCNIRRYFPLRHVLTQSLSTHCIVISKNRNDFHLQLKNAWSDLRLFASLSLSRSPAIPLSRSPSPCLFRSTFTTSQINNEKYSMQCYRSSTSTKRSRRVQQCAL